MTAGGAISTSYRLAPTCAHAAGLVANGQHRIAGDCRRDIVAGLHKLTFVRQKQPAAPENILPLPRVDVRIGIERGVECRRRKFRHDKDPNFKRQATCLPAFLSESSPGGFRMSDEDTYSPARLAAARERFIVITGCSGGGKSSLVSELARRGYQTVAEAGRQVIREQNSIGGDAVPERDAMKFLEFTISRGMHQMIALASTPSDKPVFFDRSIVDQISGFHPTPPHLERAVEIYRYGRVFIVPPWPENFRNDAERRHSFDDALGHYGAQLKFYERCGYPVTFIPKASVTARADFVLDALGKK